LAHFQLYLKPSLKFTIKDLKSKNILIKSKDKKSIIL
jgi:hypothetical protein